MERKASSVALTPRPRARNSRFGSNFYQDVDFDRLMRYSYLPLMQVSKNIGICTTILKRICRYYGIKRWPFRKVRSYIRLILKMRKSVSQTQDQREIDYINEEICAIKTKLSNQLGPTLSKEEIEQLINAYKGRSHILKTYNRHINIFSQEIYDEASPPVMPKIKPMFLPSDVLTRVLAFLPKDEIIPMINISDGFRQLILSEYFWYKLCAAHFARDTKGLFAKSWRNLYLSIVDDNLTKREHPQLFLGFIFKMASPSIPDTVPSIVTSFGGTIAEKECTHYVYSGSFKPIIPSNHTAQIIRYQSIIELNRRFVGLCT